MTRPGRRERERWLAPPSLRSACEQIAADLRTLVEAVQNSGQQKPLRSNESPARHSHFGRTTRCISLLVAALAALAFVAPTGIAARLEAAAQPVGPAVQASAKALPDCTWRTQSKWAIGEAHLVKPAGSEKASIAADVIVRFDGRQDWDDEKTSRQVLLKIAPSTSTDLLRGLMTRNIRVVVDGKETLIATEDGTERPIQNLFGDVKASLPATRTGSQHDPDLSSVQCCREIAASDDCSRCSLRRGGACSRALVASGRPRAP